MKRSLWMLILVVPLSALGQAQALSGAGVNWQGQSLRATGAGAPDLSASNSAQARLGAERTAKAGALRNLMEQAKGIPISAGRTVGDEMAREETRGRVEEVLRGFKISKKRYYSDGGVEMDVEVPLSALASVLLPSSATAPLVNAQGAKRYTGLVVDARGLGVKPVLAPRLLDGAGKPLYGPEVLSSEARRATGVAAYFSSLDEAQKNVRVGEKPLVVKAAQIQGSDLVLDEDALKQLSEANTGFLTEGRVVIVTP